MFRFANKPSLFTQTAKTNSHTLKNKFADFVGYPSKHVSFQNSANKSVSNFASSQFKIATETVKQAAFTPTDTRKFSTFNGNIQGTEQKNVALKIEKNLNLEGCFIKSLFQDVHMIFFPNYSETQIEKAYQNLKALGLKVRFKTAHHFLSANKVDPACIFLDERLEDVSRILEPKAEPAHLNIQKDHKVMVFKIPVTTTNTAEFCKQRGIYQTYKIATQLFEFVRDGLKQYDVIIDRLFKNEFSFNYFNEVVKNAYDAYAMGGLRVGEHLVMKVVIQKKDDKVVVKIKNNGIKFNNHPNSTYFERSQIKSDPKSMDYLGGVGLGLLLFEENINNLGGKLRFKNRKNEGAAVYLEFNLNNDFKFEPPTPHRKF